MKQTNKCGDTKKVPGSKNHVNQGYLAVLNSITRIINRDKFKIAENKTVEIEECLYIF